MLKLTPPPAPPQRGRDIASAEWNIANKQCNSMIHNPPGSPSFAPDHAAGTPPANTRPALPAETPLCVVPAGLVRILDRDLKLAGIPKKDSRGWTIDVHALRHTFGTLLSKGNVAPRTAQAAMRHSSLDLTMNVYTDPKLLDVAGALERLPELPLGAMARDGQGGPHCTDQRDTVHRAHVAC